MSQRRCGRCGHAAQGLTRWPDGLVCWTCQRRALHNRGLCPGCGDDRVLAGRDEDEHAICTTCAGFTHSYACRRCGIEDQLYEGRLCGRCAFADGLADLLDDGTGHIRDELIPLMRRLVSIDKPHSGLAWLYKPGVRPLLRALGRGEIALTHEAFHPIPARQLAEYLRELLMASGCLPPISKSILQFERWLYHYLTNIDNREHERILRQFATWHVAVGLRAKVTGNTTDYSARQFAGEKVKKARLFLSWLTQHEITLGECKQADLDSWHATHTLNARQKTRAFLTWCMRTGRMPQLDLPRLHHHPGAEPITQHQRIDLLGRLLQDETTPLRERVAAIILLLYAQTPSRIVKLTVNDVIVDTNTGAFLRLGDPPSPVPEPFAALLERYLDQRTNMSTAANPDSKWLFPGRRPRQPLHPNTLRIEIRKLGVNDKARSAAIRQLVLEAPAPVIAQALGYHHQTATELAAASGSPWSRYAPADHHQ